MLRGPPPSFCWRKMGEIGLVKTGWLQASCLCGSPLGRVEDRRRRSNTHMSMLLPLKEISMSKLFTPIRMHSIVKISYTRCLKGGSIWLTLSHKVVMDYRVTDAGFWWHFSRPLRVAHELRKRRLMRSRRKSRGESREGGQS